MRKLSKKQIDKRSEITDALNEKWTAYEEAVDALNAAIQEAADFRDEVVGEMQEYIDNRSEKWSDTDKGTEYTDWKDAWESATLEEIEKADFDSEVLADLFEEPGYC